MLSGGSWAETTNPTGQQWGKIGMAAIASYFFLNLPRSIHSSHSASVASWYMRNMVIP